MRAGFHSIARPGRHERAAGRRNSRTTDRRGLLAAAGQAPRRFAPPAPPPRARSATTLRFTPQQDVAAPDPAAATPYATRNNGHMVSGTLYRVDGSFRATPRMVDGHSAEDDGRRRDLALRKGLRVYDGGRVLARDRVAHLGRRAKRDPFGAVLVDATDELTSPGDRSVRFPHVTAISWSAGQVRFREIDRATRMTEMGAKLTDGAGSRHDRQRLRSAPGCRAPERMERAAGDPCPSEPGKIKASIHRPCTRPAESIDFAGRGSTWCAKPRRQG